MVLVPLAAALVAVVFAGQLARQFAQRRRPHALAWALAFGLYATGSTAVAVGLGAGWTAPVFATYWLAGPLVNVPLLATGQLLLLDRKRAWLYWSAAALVALTAVAAVAGADLDQEALAAASRDRRIPLGRDVLDGSLAYRLARPFSFTFLIVVGGAVWSAVRTRRWSILLIALGVVIVAGDSVAIRVGNGELFSLLLAAGITVMYAGFVATTRPRRPTAAPAGADLDGRLRRKA
jgi:hypothetical protein